MSASRSDWLKSAPLAATNAKADTPLFPYLAKLVRGEDLSVNDAAGLFSAMTSGQCGSNQIAAALTALTAKGETHEELVGMASVMRSLAVKIRGPKGAVDIAGTGSSPARTFSVSTAAAFVAAGAGLVVAKQSNRGITSKAGSTDVLTELGVKMTGEAEVAQTSLSGAGLCFMFAPKFYPALRRLADVRSALGIRTCLNILGLMANPAGANRQLLGVWHQSLIEPMTRALSMLKSEMAWVVHGHDGLDEVTLTGKTFVGAVKGGEVCAYAIAPADFGLKPGKIDHLKVANAKENATVIREVLAGKRRDEARSLIVLNAAAALVVGGLAPDPMHAARLAERSIDSGMAQNKLDRLIQATNKR